MPVPASRQGGDYSIGLLNIHTGDEPAARAVSTNFSVVRIKRDILRRSSIGIIATNRAPTLAGVGSNQAAGVDMNLRFYQNLSVSGYYAGTRSAGRDGDDRSYRQFDYSADRYGATYEVLKVGEAFNPEIGFLRRMNFRRQYGALRFSPRPRNIPVVLKLYFTASVDYISNNTDSLLQSRLGQGAFQLDLQSGDVLQVNHNRNYEALRMPFEISSGVVLPVGGYEFNEIEALYTLGTQRKYAGTMGVIRGGFYSGTRTEVSYSGRLEVTPRLSLKPRIAVVDASLPQGDFLTKLLTTRATFTVTPRMFASGLVQYNSSTNSFSTNIRLRWEYRPGSDLFAV